MFRSVNATPFWRRYSFARTHHGQVVVVYTVTVSDPTVISVSSSDRSFSTRERLEALAPERFERRQVCHDLGPRHLGPDLHHFQDLKIERLDAVLPSIGMDLPV